VAHPWSQKQPIWHTVEFVCMVELIIQTTKVQNHRIELGYYSRTNIHNIFLFIWIDKNNKNK